MRHPEKKQQEFLTCTLKELCPEDKQKVAKLVKQVVELGQENQRLKDAAEKTSAAAEDKVKQIQECNKQAVKENCSLKTKLGQAVTVLRMYHHKVQGLDAALRAMQHAAANPPEAVPDQGQQQHHHHTHWQQQQHTPVHGQDASGKEVSSSAMHQSSQAQQQQQQQQQQQLALLSPASVTSSPAKVSSEAEAPASAAAARLQEQAQRLSELLVPQETSPSSAAVATPQHIQDGQLFATPGHSPQGPAQPSTKACSGDSSSSNTSAKLTHGSSGGCPLRCQSVKPGEGRCRAAGCTAPCSSPEVLPGMPLVLPMQSAGLLEALRDLGAAWQLQQGLTAGQVGDMAQRKVLQFDPSVGSYGAFVIQEPPEVPSVDSRLCGPVTAATGRLSSAQHVQQLQQQMNNHRLQLQPKHSHALTVQLPVDAAAASGAGDSTGAVPPGLLDASPWESPTCKQLLDLAAAFDHLATPSTPPGGAAHSTLGTSPAAAPAAAAAMYASGASSVAPILGGVSAAQAGAVTASTMSGARSAAVAAVATGDMGIGLPCEYGVEEVPVESLGAGQLPVVVQNEKPCNSLCAVNPQICAAACAGGGGPIAIMPRSALASRQQQVPQQQHVREQPPLPVMCQHHSSSIHYMDLQCADFNCNGQHVHRQIPAQQQPGYDIWCQQEQGEPTCGVQVQQLCTQQQQQRWRRRHLCVPAAGGPVESPGHMSHPETGLHRSAWAQPAPQQQHTHMDDVGGQLVQQSMWPSQTLAQPPLQQQQPAVYFQDEGSSPSQLEQHQQHISDLGSSALCLPPADARQLLERFDESLVDLLMEVERLEQQQQQLKQQRYQQHEWQHPISGRQPPPAHSKQQAQQSLGRRSQRLQLHQHRQQRHPLQHDQGYQFVVRQQEQFGMVQQQATDHEARVLSSQQHVQGAGWPNACSAYITEAEDDDVSEMLNC